MSGAGMTGPWSDESTGAEARPARPAAAGPSTMGPLGDRFADVPPIRVFHLCDKFGIRGARTHGVSRLFTWWFPRFDPSRFELRLIGIRPEDDASAHLRGQGLEGARGAASHPLGFRIAILLGVVRQVRGRFAAANRQQASVS